LFGFLADDKEIQVVYFLNQFKKKLGLTIVVAVAIIIELSTLLAPIEACADSDKEISSPINLASAALDAGKIELFWIDNSDNEQGFTIERAFDSLFTNNVKTFSMESDNTRYVDETTSPLCTYYYRILAFNDAYESDWSNISVIMTPDFLPAAAGNLNAYSPEAFHIDLSWSDYSNNENGFRVERATDNKFTENLVNFYTKPNINRCSDTKVPAGTYYYRVIAYNGTGDSMASNAVSVKVNSNYNDGPIPYRGEYADVTVSGFAPSYVPFKVDFQGALQDRSISLSLIDQKGRIDIPKGTKLRNPNSTSLVIFPLLALNYNIPGLLPEPPDDMIVLEAFDFGPSFSSFSPAITLVLKFDPSQLPEDAGANDIQVGSWNGIKWETIDCTVNLNESSVTVKATDFSTYAIFCTEKRPPSTLWISSLLIVPDNSTAGEEIIIQPTINNDGLLPVNYEVILKLNGEVEETRLIFLEAATSSTETFYIVEKPAGYYTININGVTRNFIIRAATPASSPIITPSLSPTTVIPSSTSESDPIVAPSKPPIMWIIIIAVSMLLIVLLSVYFLFMRR